MSAYDLPTSLNIGGVGFPIRYGWRSVLDALIACSDPSLDDQAKAYCMLVILIPDYKKIPPECIAEACRKASEFIDCGQKEDTKPRPKVISWEQDGSIIIPEINKVANREVRLDPNIHWWTFFGWFMSVGEGLLASILHIRGKKAKHQKLEKWEQEFYNENKSIIDFSSSEADDIRMEKEDILKWL